MTIGSNDTNDMDLEQYTNKVIDLTNEYEKVYDDLDLSNEIRDIHEINFLRNKTLLALQEMHLVVRGKKESKNT